MNRDQIVLEGHHGGMNRGQAYDLVVMTDSEPLARRRRLIALQVKPGGNPRERTRTTYLDEAAYRALYEFLLANPPT